jgi:hypothetical protein
MLEEQHIIGEQSICAHPERNCRLRQVVEITWDAISRGDRKLGPSNASRMATASSLARRRFVTQRTSPWKTAREFSQFAFE